MDVTISPQVALLVPIVIGVVALLKQYIGTYFAPLLALAVGIGGSFLVPQATWQATLLVGFVVATTAAGTFTGGRTLAGN